MTTTHLLFLLACAGHLVLWRCDWNLTYLAGGRFDFRCLQDNDRLSAVLGGTPLKQPMGATMAGVFALTAAFPGYLALCRWMEAFSPLCAGLMLAGCVLFFLPGVAHQVLQQAELARLHVDALAGAAVDAPHQSVLLHRLKITANGLGGYAEPCDQLLHIDKARAAEQFLDTFPSYLLHSV